jgi:hypothetical protein
VHFADHGDNIHLTDYIGADHDEKALAAAHRRNVPSIRAGFDVWDEERLVHRRRN